VEELLNYDPNAIFIVVDVFGLSSEAAPMRRVVAKVSELGKRLLHIPRRFFLSTLDENEVSINSASAEVSPNECSVNSENASAGRSSWGWRLRRHKVLHWIGEG
jgi:hypothetical protein